MTQTDVDQLKQEIKKLKKVCDQLKLDLSGIELALPATTTPYIDDTLIPSLVLSDNKDKGVSLIY